MESISTNKEPYDISDISDVRTLMEQDKLKWYVPSDFSNPLTGLNILLQGYRSGLFDRVMHTHPFNQYYLDEYQYRLAQPHQHNVINKLQETINGVTMPPLPTSSIEYYSENNMDNTEQCSTTCSGCSSGQYQDDDSSHEQRMVYASSIDNAIDNLSKSIALMVEDMVRSALDNIANNIQNIINPDE